MEYLIGLDLGTGSVKTVLFDQNGKEIAQMAQEYPVYQPNNGWSEQDPEDWYTAAIATMRYVIDESGVPRDAIKGIGMSGQMMGAVMLDAAGKPLKTFMLKQTTNDDMKFFLDLKGQSMSDITDGATDNITLENYSEKLGFETVIPAFIVSELKRAFQMGFLIFIPFLVIDLVVSSTLMAMGMMMLPPAMISLPFKIILFVLVDGWQLMVGTIVNSYNL